MKVNEGETFYRIAIFASILFMVIFLVGGVVMLNQVRAENDKTFIKVPNDEWSSQVIFDTVSVCYQGTLRWVVMGNPNLMNTAPPYHIARRMTIHCFCVLDKLRTEYKFSQWKEMLFKDDPLAPSVAPREFMEKAIMCIKEHNTLQGLVIVQGMEESLKKFLESPSDNETITRKQQEESDNGSGTSDSIPEQPNEPLEEAPQLNF